MAEVLAELDRRYPGLRLRVVDEQDRIRQHMRIYVGTEAAPGLDQPPRWPGGPHPSGPEEHDDCA